MVIKNPDASEYIEPLKKLFPKGEYWDRLLSDPASDVSLVCAARSESLAAFKMRMNQLLRESLPDFADETIGDWERIYFDYENGGLELEQRRSLLRMQRSGVINIGVVNYHRQSRWLWFAINGLPQTAASRVATHPIVISKCRPLCGLHSPDSECTAVSRTRLSRPC